ALEMVAAQKRKRGSELAIARVTDWEPAQGQAERSGVAEVRVERGLAASASLIRRAPSDSVPDRQAEDPGATSSGQQAEEGLAFLAAFERDQQVGIEDLDLAPLEGAPELACDQAAGIDDHAVQAQGCRALCDAPHSGHRRSDMAPGRGRTDEGQSNR